MARLEQLATAKPKAGATTGRARSKAYLKLAIQVAFQNHFGKDGALVDVSDGYGDSIHVIVITRKFDGMDESKRQATLWRILSSAALTEKERDRVTLLFAVSPGDLK